MRLKIDTITRESNTDTSTHQTHALMSEKTNSNKSLTCTHTYTTLTHTHTHTHTTLTQAFGLPLHQWQPCRWVPLTLSLLGAQDSTYTQTNKQTNDAMRFSALLRVWRKQTNKQTNKQNTNSWCSRFALHDKQTETNRNKQTNQLLPLFERFLMQMYILGNSYPLNCCHFLKKVFSSMAAGKGCKNLFKVAGNFNFNWIPRPSYLQKQNININKT